MQIINPSAPSAGQNLTVTVPASTYYLVHIFKFNYTTDANVVTRQIRVIIDDGTNILYQTPDDAGQAAGLGPYTYSYIAMLPFIAPGLTAYGGTSSLRQNGWPKIILGPGYRIRTSIGSIQAGDAFTNIFLYADVSNSEYVANGNIKLGASF